MFVMFLSKTLYCLLIYSSVRHVVIRMLLASDKSLKIELALITDLPEISLRLRVSRELCVRIGLFYTYYLLAHLSFACVS